MLPKANDYTALIQGLDNRMRADIDMQREMIKVLPQPCYSPSTAARIKPLDAVGETMSLLLRRFAEFEQMPECISCRFADQMTLLESE